MAMSLNRKRKYFDDLLEEFGNLQDKSTSIALLDEHWIHSLSLPDKEFLMQNKGRVYYGTRGY